MKETNENYNFPPLTLLDKGKEYRIPEISEDEKARVLESLFARYGAFVHVLNIYQGIRVTRYEFIPVNGTRIADIMSLYEDIKMNYCGSEIRVEKQVPGKAAMALEVVDWEYYTLRLRTLLESGEINNKSADDSFIIGVGTDRRIITFDWEDIENIMITGSTGSGKTVFISSLIMNILYKYEPEKAGLILIDPKIVEYSQYSDLPNLLLPVITDSRRAVAILKWLCTEIKERFTLLAETHVHTIDQFNRVNIEKPKMKKIIVFIDEIADLMLMYHKETEASIIKLLQQGARVGIHIVFSTQRPVNSVITGNIRANVNSDISFYQDPEYNEFGAEEAAFLTGMGDMLYYQRSNKYPVRAQGVFVSNGEVERVVKYITEHNGYLKCDEELIKKIDRLENSLLDQDENNISDY